MKTTTHLPCANCVRLQEQLNAQQAQLQAVLARQADLEATLVQVQAQLAAARKNSSTSSKPPSSDIVKPPKPGPPPGQGKRRIGGQPGHPKHERLPFPPELVSKPEEHTLEACPCCGGPLRRNGGFAKVVQQVDIITSPLHIEQHTCPEYWCDRCKKACKAAMPSHIDKGGLVGPGLTALIAFMKGPCHASYSTVRTFLRDIVGVTLCRGQLSKVVNKASAALAAPYEELLRLLPNEPTINGDETGHKRNGKPWWTWCF
jgi:transposase